jgi:two-component system chemotaxis response regulator CheY
MPKFLIVDDSATMRKIIMKSLSAAIGACEFVEAGDGMEGLQALAKEEDVDAVLSDINMPNMDGIQFVRCVRDQKAMEAVDVDGKKLIKKVSNTTPIIMITTESSLEKVQEALAAGANDYLKKPFTPDQLNEKLGPFLS